MLNGKSIASLQLQVDYILNIGTSTVMWNVYERSSGDDFDMRVHYIRGLGAR